jgi:hypothetical protein
MVLVAQKQINRFKGISTRVDTLERNPGPLFMRLKVIKDREGTPKSIEHATEFWISLITLVLLVHNFSACPVSETISEKPMRGITTTFITR